MASAWKQLGPIWDQLGTNLEPASAYFEGAHSPGDIWGTCSPLRPASPDVHYEGPTASGGRCVQLVVLECLLPVVLAFVRAGLPLLFSRPLACPSGHRLGFPASCALLLPGARLSSYGLEARGCLPPRPGICAQRIVAGLGSGCCLGPGCGKGCGCELDFCQPRKCMTSHSATQYMF